VRAKTIYIEQVLKIELRCDVEFCEKCGALMLPGKSGTIVSCHTCGKRAKSGDIILTEKLEKSKKLKKVGKEVRDTMPIGEMECPKCGNKEAYFWSEQTRGSDEPETQFYRCTKCSNTWRLYS